ncbi:MAG: FAD-dependent oxidoreductase [Brevundimonas sp.]|uniref:phytoene desaturase family protein n=1 Tax=Brevundimonas sp. TaxID=1871086 RepID=UPI0027365BD1|nr:FAD-dependent oxidoreductase [Brevundimonas sp.]MDP3403479.1 FAD-dependent oxidoreductase [Brevundimonas sp.]
MEKIYDAIIIGAGAGGLCTAARLVNAGRSVLLLDDHDRVGGRATSFEKDGFILNMGAIALERGGVFDETFHQTGVGLDIREPDPATVFRIDGKTVNVAKGGWAMLLGGLTKQAAQIGARFADARSGELPEEKLTTEAWLKGLTRNRTVHRLFRNLCAAIFAVNSSELPARAFLVYFGTKGAFKRFGFCPRGTIGVWNDLADGVRRKGGEIRLNTRVTRILVEDGVATGVEIHADGGARRLRSRLVVSNAGPLATISLAGEDVLGADYVDRARDLIRPSANIVIDFATREPLIDAPGLVTFANTDRLCNIGEMTATCPEMAPPGWRLYTAYAVPLTAIGDFDEDAEIAASLQELHDEFPGFADARMLGVRVMRGDWPAQRSCAGFDLEQATPIANLWNVGDAVKTYGSGGTEACAETARIVSAEAVAWLEARP